MDKCSNSLEEMHNKRIILVSNRASFVLQETPQGLKGERSVGGLVSALEPLMSRCHGVWVAWAGRQGKRKNGVRIGVPLGKPNYTLREVVLTPEEVEGYYHSFANRTLWPLSHYCLEKCSFCRQDWEIYRSVNTKFADLVLEEVVSEDLLWIHDYHLSLVPQLLRSSLPASKIGFFWHIPFPDLEVFRALPQARQVLRGLLGSSFIGFHVPSYCRNFLDAVAELLGARVNTNLGTIDWEGRRIVVKDIPVGVDYADFTKFAENSEVQKAAGNLRLTLGVDHLLLGVDRLDYTKGIKERLQGYELFLEKNPQYHGKAAFIQIAVPSRNGVPEYKQLRSQVEELVGRINGRFGKPDWTPVIYYYGALKRQELVSYYQAADMLLVTPLRDGLNLVAKEYVASRLRADGVLVLSIFAGASEDLEKALPVNPFDPEEIAVVIQKGLEMSSEEKAARMRSLRSAVSSRDVLWWLESFVASWLNPGEEKSLRVLTSEHWKKEKNSFLEALGGSGKKGEIS